MKKIFKLISVFLVVGFLSICFVNAECDNEELNEWATKIEPVFRENTVLYSNISKYAYFLTISPYREDARIVVIDGNGNKAEGEYFEEIDLYAVGAFTNLEEETYTFEVYGAKGGKCEKDLLKKLSYTVPRFNRRVKDSRCENNSELEICKTFTNSTKDMTEEQFNKEIEQYIKENKTFTIKDIINSIISYGLFIVVPVLIIGFIYFRKIRKVKKEERDR